MLRRILASCMITLVLFSSFGQGAFAVEIEAVNSLDVLPYDSEAAADRERLLESIDSLRTDAQEKIETISSSIEIPEDMISLLSEKRSFELTAPTLTPGFIIDPFSRVFSGTNSVLSSFLGESFASHISDDFSTGDMFTSREVGKSIRVQNIIKRKERVSGVAGNLSIEIAPGTIITTLSGDIIDSAKIGILPIDSNKKLQAKTQYERKMKNRGNKRKGLGEAAVEGFEFGLPGTHLIFSSPVALTIDTPTMGEGMAVDILTLHAGDTSFHTGGLSTNSNTTCQDGVASLPGSQAIVKNGKVTFYTCGASSFTMNPTGGTAGSNDLRIIIGDCAQAQIYYNNLTQIYTGNPAATGCGLPGLWAALRIGGTTYGNGVDGVTATAWSTQSTTGSTNGNTYTATSTMTAVVGGLTYTLIIDWSHTAPNKYFTWSYRVMVPVGNTQNVRFYFANDSFLAGADTNDVGYYTMTGGQTVGVYDNVANVLSAFRYLSGAAWTAYEVGPYATVAGRITGGTDFANTVQMTPADLGFGVNWNFGTGANITYSGSTEWRLLPYVSANVPDLIPGIGQPEGPLTTNLLSQMPITITNAGNLASSGVHTVVLTIPTNITGPTSSFSDNGWSCGAQVGTGVTCTKTTAITVPSGTDTFRIPVTPTLAASGTSVTFNVSISNPGDSNIGNNTAFAINAVVGGAPANDPGGITGENLWLRANTGTNCIATGCTITTWTNQGALGTAANAVTGLGTATYDPANRINGNPTIYMNGASFNTNSNLGLPTRANSIFTVSRIGAGGNFYMGTQTVTNNTRYWRTSPTSDTWMRYNSTIFYSGANQRVANIPAITSTIRQTAGASAGYTNGRSVLTNATNTTFTVNNFGIGRVGNTNSTLTNLAEIIIYPTVLTLPQKNRVESYLAVKYGITLDQTTATDYVYSNGTIAWNAASAGIYKNNIAGIGRDDLTTLSQSRSQSVTNTGDIIVSKSVLATNLRMTIWAHDAGQITSFTGVDSPFGFERMGRVWQFQEKNGDIGIVDISYPNTSVASGFVAPLMLLADTDITFATGAVAYTGTYNTGSNTWDFSLNISDMQYIAFAKMVPTDTTPPNILSNSVASGTLTPIGTFPITVTYSDTGSTINTSSFTGKIYAWDSTGSTWSLTNIAAGYLSITSASASTGVFQLTGLPFGKYRFDISIADTLGNVQTQSNTYYIDDVSWSISAPTYNIGPVQTSILGFGTGELIVIVNTVGAGFDLSMLRTNDLTYITDVIPVYSGSTGWGYDKNIGAGYSGFLTAHGTTQTLVSVVKSININGQKNTFTYRVKYGVNASANTPAGDYTTGMVRFGLNLTY